MVADHLDQQLPLKTFHARLVNQVKDPEALPSLPILREVSEAKIYEKYMQVKKEIERLVQREIQLILDSSDDSNLFPTSTARSR
jgi:hypothetical protein